MLHVTRGRRIRAARAVCAVAHVQATPAGPQRINRMYWMWQKCQVFKFVWKVQEELLSIAVLAKYLLQHQLKVHAGIYTHHW